MTLVKFQVGQSGESLLPRDQAVNTLFFSVGGGVSGAPDYEALCTDLANIYDTRWQQGNNPKFEINVRAYNADVLLGAAGGKTGPPEFVFKKYAGQSPEANFPREVALCLSYYATVNRPGKRGRIYLPQYIAAGLGSPGGRPNTTQMNAAKQMAIDFGNLGGINVDWLLYSPKMRATYKITQAWVDNEWDTQRSRGLRATSRVTTEVAQ